MLKVLGDVTFDEICRICLGVVDKNPISLEIINVRKMLTTCTSIKLLSSEDNLPQQLCKNCYEKLQDSYNLWHLSEISEEKLRNFLTNENKVNLEEDQIKIEENGNWDNFSPSPSEPDNTPISPTPNLECDICHKIFLNKHKLKKHYIAHSTDRPFQCNSCPKSFKEKCILNKHVKTVHIDDRKNCPICERTIVKSSLERHLQTHKNPPSIQCTECTKKFLDNDTLEKHIRRVHKKETSLELYPFLCNQCGKGLISKSELKRHMNSHFKETIFKCSKCTKAYTSHAGLRSHIKVFHLNERPFRCSVCVRAFPTKIILKHHMRTHTGEKPFKCLICTKTFALKCVLKTHLKIHD